MAATHELKFQDAKIVATVGSDGAAAAFDPSNPEETPLVIEPLAEDAGLVTKAYFYGQVTRQYVRDKTKNLRPWREFADRDEFSLPTKITALANISHNLTFWSGNYAAIAIVLFIYTALTNIVLTVGMVLCGAAYSFVKNSGETVSVAGREMSRPAAYAAVVTMSLLTFYLSGGAGATFYLVTIIAGVVLGHAACRKPVESGTSVNPAFSFA